MGRGTAISLDIEIKKITHFGTPKITTINVDGRSARSTGYNWLHASFVTKTGSLFQVANRNSFLFRFELTISVEAIGEFKNSELVDL